MPEPGDHDGREGQRVEQAEYAVQRVADAPGDARDRGGGQGELRREVVNCGRGDGRAPGQVADDKASAPSTEKRPMASGQPTSVASPRVARERALDEPGDRELDRPAGGRHDDRIARPRRPSGAPASRGRITEPPASSAASAAVRSPARNVSRPSASKSAPRIATASRRVPSKARSNDAIGVARATPSIAAISGPYPSLPIGAGAMRREDLVARHDVARARRSPRTGR